MKKLTTLLLLLTFLGSGHAYSQSTWRAGLSLAPSWNPYHFEGDGIANGRFRRDPIGTGFLSVYFRKDISTRWAFETGLTAGSIGFAPSLTHDYQLSSHDQSSVERLEQRFGYAMIPLTMKYFGKVDCKGWRPYLQAGITLQSVPGSDTKESKTQIGNPSTSTTTTSDYMILTSEKLAGGGMGLVFGFGWEKELKKGNIFSLGLLITSGTTDLVRGEVSYDIDGKSYQHSFTNRGNFVGVGFSYYFQPFGTRKGAGKNQRFEVGL